MSERSYRRIRKEGFQTVRKEAPKGRGEGGHSSSDVPNLLIGRGTCGKSACLSLILPSVRHLRRRRGALVQRPVHGIRQAQGRHRHRRRRWEGTEQDATVKQCRQTTSLAKTELSLLFFSFKNRPHLTFDDVSGLKADQEFDLVQDNEGRIQYPTKSVRDPCLLLVLVGVSLARVLGAPTSPTK